jgi:hypothetical protein
MKLDNAQQYQMECAKCNHTQRRALKSLLIECPAGDFLLKFEIWNPDLNFGLDLNVQALCS